MEKKDVNYAKRLAKELVELNDDYSVYTERIFSDEKRCSLNNVANLIQCISDYDDLDIDDYPDLSELGEYIALNEYTFLDRFFQIVKIEFYKNI